MFDGVHHGHQAVLSETIGWARDREVPAVAITFDIHPRALLDPDGAPPMITSLKHRLTLFSHLGIDAAVILTFDHDLAAKKPDDFIKEHMVDALGAQGVVLGYRAHFGKDRRGDFELLTRIGKQNKFETREVSPASIDGKAVSSTAIRELVGSGNLTEAAKMLGRPVSVLGTVVRGKGKGRTLGFPTLNLNPHHELKPPKGVYITRTRCGNTEWPSVTNIGYRPTLYPQSVEDVIVESHLLEPAGMLYGQTVEVMFEAHLRDEMRFDHLDALRKQIQQDAKAARAYFKL